MARQKKYIDLIDVEKLAALGLSVKEICCGLGIHRDTFYENQKRNSEFSNSIASGRSKAIIACAQVVVDAAINGKNPKYALEYLKRFADGWKDNVSVPRHYQAGIFW